MFFLNMNAHEGVSDTQSGALGGVLEPFAALLGGSWAPLGALLEGSWSILGTSWADLKAFETRLKMKSDFKSEKGAPVQN